MALKLIRSGPVTRQGVVSPGSGWVNVTGYSDTNITNPYWGETGVYHITVTAWNADDLRIIDWDNGKGEVVAPTGGQYHTISAVMDLSETRLVIRVLNPTDKTKVIVNMQPLSLSLSLFVEFAAAFVRWWRNGAEENCPRYRNRLGYGLVGEKDRECGGTTNRWIGCAEGLSRPVRPYKNDLRASVRSIDHHLLHTPRRDQSRRSPYPAGLHREGVRNYHLHRLTAVGGDA